MLLSVRYATGRISDTVHIIDNGKVIVSRKNEGIEDMSRYYLEVIGKGGAYA